MKRALLLFLVALSATAQNTQGNNQANIGGLLIASNFAQWTVPQGNQGGYTWSSPDFCKVTFAGATFNAFSPGTPVEIVDTGNPANNETVTVNNFASTASQCSIYVNPAHAHNTFYFRSATGGLGEALAYAGHQLFQIIVTPDFTKLGGTTSTITSAVGNANVTILDQRSSVIIPYLWSGSAYVANPFGGGGSLPTAGAAGAIPVSTGAGTTYTALPANANPGQGVLVSTAATSTVVPTTKTCAHEAGASVNTSTCTWSSAPVAGESLFCYVISNTTSTTFTLSDSASNTYTPYGGVHFSAVLSDYIQTFYTNPISSSVSSTTVTATAGNFLTIQCDSASNIAASSPTDGQGTVDTSSTPITSPTITTTASGDYIFCGAVAYFAETLSPGLGYTGGASFNNNGLNQYATQAAAGAITPSMSGSEGAGASMTCSAFKAGAAVTPAQTNWSQNLTLNNVQAQNTEVIPIPPTPSGGDDYLTLQTAINTAISENRILFVPCGFWKTSAGLVANSTNFKMHGCGNGQAGPPWQNTQIAASGLGYNTLTIGTGTPWELPQGWARDFIISGPTAWYNNAGFSSLVLSGTVQYVVDSVSGGSDDIGFNLTNNNFGMQILNSNCQSFNTNVCLNLPTGAQSGSDLYFRNNWFHGAKAAVSISPNGGGYHFIGGQYSAQVATVCDTCGTFIYGKDYRTGATGISSFDVQKISFEATQNAWAFRGFGQANLVADTISINADGGGGPALGVIKSESFGAGHLALKDIELEGSFANTVGGCPLAVITGTSNATNPNYAGLNIREVGTNGGDVSMSICNTFTKVQSILAQSGIQQLGNITGLAGISVPGNGNSTPLTLINDNSGNLQTSPSTGCFTNGTCVAYPVANLPAATRSFDIPYVNSAGINLARLAGNGVGTDEVVVSHGLSTGTPVAQTYTCGTVGSGTTNPISCTWSTSPTSGMFVACQATNFQGGSTGLSVTDSASNTYTAIGSQHTVWSGGGTQTFYFGPLAGTITTNTVTTSSAVNALGIKCQAVTNVQPIIDGAQCTNDVTSGTSLTCSTALTTTAANDFLFCGAVSVTGPLTAGSGFTLGSTDYSPGGANQYKIQSSAGSIAPSITFPATTDATMTCTAFKSQAAQAPFLTNTPQLGLVLYTVSSGSPYPALPSASSVAAGTQVGVTDCTSYTPGALCTGGGSDFMIGISNGTVWTVH